MGKVLRAAILVAVITGVVAAAPVPCPEHGSLQSLISLSGAGNGCIIDDKIFNNFTYSGGSISASNVFGHLVFPTGTNSPDVHGWVFAIGDNSAWTTNFSLGYSVGIAPGNPFAQIIGSKDQINTGFLPNGVVATDVQTPGTLVTRGLSGQETTQINYGGVTSLTTLTSFTIPVGSQLQSFEQDWLQTQVPEPSTVISLLGGMAVIGFMRLRRGKGV